MAKCLVWAGASLLAATAAIGRVEAQIVTDGTVGPVVSLDGPTVEIGDALGTVAGSNLFHSFADFNVATGQAVSFTGPNTIAHVVSRVTGGAMSTIDGRLASEVGTADVWLINPAGVAFGPAAEISVPAALHVSTADTLGFADGTEFNARDPGGSHLSVASPEAFGFLGPAAGDLVIDGSQLAVVDHEFSLGGGAIRIAGDATVRAPRGRLALTARDTVTVEGGSAIGGDLFLPASIAIDAGGLAIDGAVTTGGDDITLTTAGDIRIGPDAELKTWPSPGASAGDITIDAGGDLVMDGIVRADVFVAGNAGTIRLAAGNDLSTAGEITAHAFDDGNPGTITLTAGDTLLFTGKLLRSCIFCSNDENPPLATFVRFDAGGDLVLSDAFVSATTFGAAGSGRLTMVGRNITFDAVELFSATTGSGVAGSGEGEAGTITVAAREGLVLRDTEILTTTFLRGAAGSVALSAGTRLTVGAGTEIKSEADTLATVRAGQITLAAPILSVEGGGVVTTSVLEDSVASGGGITLTATDTLTITGAGSAVRSENGGTSTEAGQVGLAAGTIRIADGGLVSTSSTGAGGSGAIRLVATDRLQLADGRITTQSTEGGGGTIDIQARELIDLFESQITTEVAGGAGDAGDITIDPEAMVLQSSLIRANAVGGDGGNIRIQVGSLISDRASVIEASSELGVSGQIDISAPETDVSGGLVVLATDFLDAASSLTDRCAAAAAGRGSRFASVGRGGVPAAPDVPLPSFLIAAHELFVDADHNPAADRRAAAPGPISLAMACGG